MTKIVIDTVDHHHLLFDDTNVNWSPQVEYNLAFIRLQTAYFQDHLAVRRHLFVNEVLDAFGFDRTPDGQVSGWLAGGERLAIEAEADREDANKLWIKFSPHGVIVNDI